MGASFKPSPKQRGVLFAAAYPNIVKFATPQELKVVQKALYFLNKNGLVYNVEIATAIKILKRARSARQESITFQNVPAYTKKDGTFVKSYVRQVKNNLK